SIHLLIFINECFYRAQYGLLNNRYIIVACNTNLGILPGCSRCLLAILQHKFNRLQKVCGNGKGNNTSSRTKHVNVQEQNRNPDRLSNLFVTKKMNPLFFKVVLAAFTY